MRIRGEPVRADEPVHIVPNTPLDVDILALDTYGQYTSLLSDKSRTEGNTRVTVTFTFRPGHKRAKGQAPLFAVVASSSLAASGDASGSIALDAEDFHFDGIDPGLANAANKWARVIAAGVVHATPMVVLTDAGKQAFSSASRKLGAVAGSLRVRLRGSDGVVVKKDHPVVIVPPPPDCVQLVDGGGAHIAPGVVSPDEDAPVATPFGEEGALSRHRPRSKWPTLFVPAENYARLPAFELGLYVSSLGVFSSCIDAPEDHVVCLHDPSSSLLFAIDEPVPMSASALRARNALPFVAQRRKEEGGQPFCVVPLSLDCQATFEHVHVCRATVSKRTTFHKLRVLLVPPRDARVDADGDVDMGGASNPSGGATADESKEAGGSTKGKGKGKGKGSGKKRGKRKQTRGQAPKYTEAELEAMTVAHVVMAVSPARTPVAVRVMDTAAKAPAPVSKRGHGCRRCKRS